jgi:predicted nucleic acid-binding protein
LDTSFVAEALLPREPLHMACQQLLLRIVEDGTVVCFNRLLEVELYEVTYKLALKERYRNRWQDHRLDGRARRRANRLSQAMLHAWQELLGAMNYAVVELNEVTNQIPGIMGSYGLSSYDAIHAATAFYFGIDNMVSLDSGFSAVPASKLILYTNTARVGRCRRLRGRGRRHS